MHSALAIEGLTRRFGRVIANDSVDLQVRSGDVVGLLGHNGAGKTTVISQVVGLLRPDAGSIRLGAVDAVRNPAGARRMVTLQPQAQTPIDGLTPRTAIELAGRVRGASPRDARAAAPRIAEEVDIGAWLDRRALPDGRGLSGGIRRLVGFAMALAGPPTPLLILDEPTNDVDAARRRLLWAAVRRRADNGAGVLLVTHNVTEAERIVDAIVVLDRGRVVASGTPAQLRGPGDGLRLELHLADPGAEPSGGAQPPFATTRQVRAGRRLVLNLGERDAAQAVQWASRLRETDRIESYALGPTSIEDAYLALTSGDATAGAAQ